jgi:hypothetical protein
VTCTAVTIWPDVGPHGVRLACCLPSGHDGDHAAAEVEWLTGEES